jgi:hypothetical protein
MRAGRKVRLFSFEKPGSIPGTWPGQAVCVFLVNSNVINNLGGRKRHHES